jgi:hypothetical protein
MMEYFNAPFLNIYWIEDVKAVHMEWKKYAAGDKFRNGLDKGLELITAKGSSRWLADLRDMQVVNQEDQEWSNEDWTPRAVKAGIRHMAILVPKDVFGKTSVDRIMEKMLDIGLTTHYFESVDEAKNWLKSVH